MGNGKRARMGSDDKIFVMTSSHNAITSKLVTDDGIYVYNHRIYLMTSAHTCHPMNFPQYRWL